MSRWRIVIWSLRRELWESRSIWMAPIAVAAVALFGFLISAARLPAKVRALAGDAPAAMHGALQQPYDFAAGLLMFTTMIVAVFYATDSLYGERRDRSILFWKSMPVSDATTVLVKAGIAIVLLPAISFAVTIVLYVVMGIASIAIVATAGLNVSSFWAALALPEMSWLLLYHLATVHAISWAPFFAWMLLVSAWSRRAPLVWALVPPLAIGIVEKIAFNTSHFAAALGSLAAGAGSTETMGSSMRMPLDPTMTHLTPGRFLFSPGLWIGLVLTAGFLAAAVRLRRSQAPA